MKQPSDFQVFERGARIETFRQTMENAIRLARAEVVRAEEHVALLERYLSQAENNNGMVAASRFVPHVGGDNVTGDGFSQQFAVHKERRTRARRRMASDEKTRAEARDRWHRYITSRTPEQIAARKERIRVWRNENRDQINARARARKRRERAAKMRAATFNQETAGSTRGMTGGERNQNELR